MSRAILTLPMMPVDGTNYGKYVTPIVCETLRNISGDDTKYYHCINLLDSFNDRGLLLPNYISSLEGNNIGYDALWYDKDNIDRLLENLDLLIKLGYIMEIDSEIFRCDCGIIEIEGNKINSCNPNNLKFHYSGSDIVCNYCGTKCKKYSEKILIFVPSKISGEDIMFLPGYLNKDKKTYNDTIINSYVTISRMRNTGIQLNYNGTKYNIDIDFLWSTYLSLFSEEEKIVVSGNKMMYQLFLVGLLEKCIKPDSKTILLGTPYLTNVKTIINSSNFIQDDKFRKLAILFNLKWPKKEKDYDESILRYLRKIGENERNNLYDIVNKGVSEELDFYAQISAILNNNMNMQKCIKMLNRKEVR